MFNRKVLSICLFVTKNDHFAQRSQIKFFSGSKWFQVGLLWFFMVFHGSRSVFMVPGWFSCFFMFPGWFFKAPAWFSWFFMVPGRFLTVPGRFFMVPGRFSWFQVGFHGFSWFQVGSSWFFMVFLQNVPAQTVSWPHDPI